MTGGWDAVDEPGDCMRQPRIQVDLETDEAVYHCMTRVVIKERLFDDPAREILRRLQPEPLRRPFCRLGTGALRRGFLPVSYS